MYTSGYTHVCTRLGILVHVPIWVYSCMYSCMYPSGYTRACTRACTHLGILVRVLVHVPIWVYSCMYSCVYSCMYPSGYTRACTQTMCPLVSEVFSTCRESNGINQYSAFHMHVQFAYCIIPSSFCGQLARTDSCRVDS